MPICFNNRDKRNNTKEGIIKLKENTLVKTTEYVFGLPAITPIKLFLEQSYKITLYGRVLNAWISLFAIFLKQN